MRKSAIAVLIAAAVTLGACNTVKGAGRDIQSVGQAGDWIEIGMLGAYGAAMKTGFNGFGTAEAVTVADEPMASLYTGDRVDPRKSENVVSLR